MKTGVCLIVSGVDCNDSESILFATSDPQKLSDYLGQNASSFFRFKTLDLTAVTGVERELATGFQFSTIAVWDDGQVCTDGEILNTWYDLIEKRSNSHWSIRAAVENLRNRYPGTGKCTIGGFDIDLRMCSLDELRRIKAVVDGTFSMVLKDITHS